MNGTVKKLDYTDNHDHWLIISGYQYCRKSARLKNIVKKRGNCYFAAGVSKEIMLFCYRAVRKLELTGTNFIFSKGAVKRKGISLQTGCHAEKIPWDIGISVKIPQKLRVSEQMVFKIGDEIHSLRIMEIVILGALLKIRYPHKTQKWYSDYSVLVLARGWAIIHEESVSEVLFMKKI